MVHARFQVCLLASDSLAFGGNLHRAGCLLGSGDDEFNRETVARIGLARHDHRFQAQLRLGPAGKFNGIDGRAHLLRLVTGAGDAAFILVAIGKQQQFWNKPFGHGGHAFADGPFKVGAAANFAFAMFELKSLGCFPRRFLASCAGKRNHLHPIAAALLGHLIGDGRSAIQPFIRNAFGRIHQNGNRHFRFGGHHRRFGQSQQNRTKAQGLKRERSSLSALAPFPSQPGERNQGNQ